MTTGEKLTFNCVVKSKAEEADGYKLELDIAQFRTKFPTVIYRIDPETADTLEIGNSYQLVLERQNPKRNQDGSDKDPSKLYNWWWGLDSVASGPVSQVLPPEPQVGTQKPLAIDATGMSIQRQVALKAAVEWCGLQLQSGVEVKTVTILQVAAVFNQFLLTGKAPGAKEGDL